MNKKLQKNCNKSHSYSLEVYNGRIKIKVDGYVMVTFNQLDFVGYYAYKDDSSLYGIEFYTKNTSIETNYKTKEVWLSVLKLLDENL